MEEILLSNNDEIIADEVWTDLDKLSAPTEKEAQLLSNTAKLHAKNLRGAVKKENVPNYYR